MIFVTKKKHTSHIRRIRSTQRCIERTPAAPAPGIEALNTPEVACARGVALPRRRGHTRGEASAQRFELRESGLQKLDLPPVFGEVAGLQRRLGGLEL